MKTMRRVSLLVLSTILAACGGDDDDTAPADAAASADAPPSAIDAATSDASPPDAVPRGNIKNFDVCFDPSNPNSCTCVLTVDCEDPNSECVPVEIFTGSPKRCLPQC